LTPERYATLRTLFLAARDLPPHDHAAFVRERCAGDDELATALQRLLATDAAGGTFLAKPALGADFVLPEPDALRADALPPGCPEWFGTYRLLSVLGHGGMGIVYRALQQSPPREVALKVLQPGRADARHLERFRFEVEALGRLQHPGIATIHDAGTFDLGAGPQPYLAMERVDGAPLLEHAARAALGRTARIDLLARIADAIQHAHQRGIVHRDLKPANVLVDGSGQPKVVDFGIALAKAAGDAEPARSGGRAEPLGTLPYMSPEQLGADRTIDTRTDVYSLGVVAFELLTGRLPFRLDGLSAAQAARIVANEAPPSLVVVDPSAGADLAAIVAKALAKTPERRYASAGDLAADLRRFLAHEPVEANPPGSWRRLRLFARRHRTLVAGAASTVLALLIGLAATTRALGEARAARQLAETRLVAATTSAARAEAVRGFVLGMLAKLDPRASDGDNGADRLLAAATRELESRFAAHPDLEGELRLVLAGVLRLFGRYEEALDHVDTSVALRTRELGATAPATLAARCERLKILLRRDDLSATLATLEPLLADCERVLGADDERTLECSHALVRCRLVGSRFDEAAALLPSLLAALERQPALPPELRLDVQLTHVDCMIARGDLQLAHDTLVACVAESRQRLGDSDPTTIDALHSLATLLLGFGASARAAPLVEEVRRHHASRLPATHPLVLQCEHNLGVLAADESRNEDAIRHLRAAATGRLLVFGPRSQHRLVSLLSLANALGQSGRAAEAKPLFDELLEAAGDGMLGKPWFVATARGYQALNTARLGDRAAALAALERCVAELEAIEGPGTARAERFREFLDQLRQRQQDTPNAPR
jgi:tetratricopeptide (TPR) repeat protein